jgi:hypothetical protein
MMHGQKTISLVTVCPINLIAVSKNNTHKLKKKIEISHDAAAHSLGIAVICCSIY